MGFCSARPSADLRPLRPPSPGPSLPDPEDPPDALLPLPSGDSEAPWPVAEGDSELEPFASLTSAPAVSFRVSTSAFASSSASGSTVDPLKKSSSFCFCRVEEVEKFELDAGEGADLIVDANAGFRACRPSAEVDESRDNGGARLDVLSNERFPVTRCRDMCCRSNMVSNWSCRELQGLELAMYRARRDGGRGRIWWHETRCANSSRAMMLRRQKKYKIWETGAASWRVWCCACKSHEVDDVLKPPVLIISSRGPSEKKKGKKGKKREKKKSRNPRRRLVAA